MCDIVNTRVDVLLEFVTYCQLHLFLLLISEIVL